MRLISEIQVEGPRVIVHADPEFSKRFLREPYFAEYSIGVDRIPDDVATIPFLATMLPIAWRFGCEIELLTADAAFVDSMQLARERLRAMYPEYEWAGEVDVRSRTRVSGSPEANKVGILFSGGVDSTFSVLRAAGAGADPVLITIWGNDVKLHDVRGWEDVSGQSARLSKAIGGEACTVKSNFRSCLRYDVLDKGNADLSIIFTTDAQLFTSNDYVTLEDDKHVLPAGNVIFIASQDAVDEAGPDFGTTIEKVQGNLSLEVMQELNARVDIDKEKPEQAAQEYLQEFGYID